MKKYCPSWLKSRSIHLLLIGPWSFLMQSHIYLPQASLGWKLGLSCSGVHQAGTIRAAIGRRTADGGRLFDSVQATWNLLEQSSGEALQEAHDQGMHIIIKEAMANGRLLLAAPDDSSSSTRGGPHSAAPAVSRASRKLAEVAARLGSTPDAVALAVVMAQPFRPMVLSGAATTAHLR